MARREARPRAERGRVPRPLRRCCPDRGRRTPIRYENRRAVAALDGPVRPRLKVRRREDAGCVRHHRPFRPEAEGAIAAAAAPVRPRRDRPGRDLALPRAPQRARDPPRPARARRGGVRAHGRQPARPRSLPSGGLSPTGGTSRSRRRWTSRGAPPWPSGGGSCWRSTARSPTSAARSCGSSATACPARSCSPARCSRPPRPTSPGCRARSAAVGVPVAGVVSDGQHSVRLAVGQALPGVPHQLCHFHYLREAALPIFEADRHAKKEPKERVRGVRPSERAVEGRDDSEAEAGRGHRAVVRSALIDDGRPPLAASGLRLRRRPEAVAASLGGSRKGGTGQAAAADRGPRRARPGAHRRPVARRPPGLPPVPRGRLHPRRPGRARRARRAGPLRAPPGGLGRAARRGRHPGRGRRSLHAGHRQPPARPVPPLPGRGPAAHRQRAGAAVRGAPPPRAPRHRPQGGLARAGAARRRPARRRRGRASAPARRA